MSILDYLDLFIEKLTQNQQLKKDVEFWKARVEQLEKHRDSLQKRLGIGFLTDDGKTNIPDLQKELKDSQDVNKILSDELNKIEQKYEYTVNKLVDAKFLLDDAGATEIYDGIEHCTQCISTIPNHKYHAKPCLGTRIRNFLNNIDDPNEEPEPIHEWFGLSYAQYLTIPRSVLQSMPHKWQTIFARCLRQLDDTIDWRPESGRYYVQLKDSKGRFMHDPLMDYERGRRKVPLKESFATNWPDY